MRFRLLAYLSLTLVLAACTNVAPELDVQAQRSAQRIEPEAKSFTQDSEAEGGEAAILHKTGQRATFKLDEVTSDTYKVSVRARADEYGGWPVMRLYRNGQRLGEDNPVKREGYGEGAQKFGEAELAQGDVLEAEFINDLYEGEGKDRNLIVDYLILEPVEGGTVEPPAPKPDTQDKITLPVEVIGPDGYSEEVTFEVKDSTGIDTLYLKAHRLAYRDASTNPGRGAKGSVRLNGGDWLDLSNDTKGLECYANEAAYGCLNGSYHTVRFKVPIEGARAGENTLEFRFNGHDEKTSGYRILEMNLLEGDKEVLLQSTFRDDDPTTWEPPLDSSSDIQKGQKLWEEATLADFPDGPKIKATCSGCHTADGRDLQYYAFSNWSIQERAKFHDLSELEGEQIASYIRSLDVAPHGRPWNPPYQPGPDLDDKPVERWAAGAGLDAVLEKDEDMKDHLFPKGTSQAALNRALDLKGTLNVRELPVPVQLPDWQAWLPHVHPRDLWGGAYDRSDAAKVYEEVSAGFGDGADLEEAEDLVESLMDRTWDATFSAMRGPVPCKRYAEKKKAGNLKPSLMDDLPSGKTCEDGLQAVNHLLAVKNWELFRTYELEEAPSKLYPYGEARGWIGVERNVFEVAPHRSADNFKHFGHQSKAVGAYESNAWYHLQLVLNSGYRDRDTFRPQDWFYTGNWLAISARENEVELPLMFAATHLKMLQNLDLTGPDGRGEDTGPDKDGWWISFVHPWRLESRLYTSSGQPLADLDGYEKGLRVKVANALLREWLDKTRSYDVSELPRADNPKEPGGQVYEHPDYIVPTDVSSKERCFYSCPGDGYHARDLYRALYRYREMGVDEKLRGEMIDWAKEVWPHPQMTGTCCVERRGALHLHYRKPAEVPSA